MWSWLCSLKKRSSKKPRRMQKRITRVCLLWFRIISVSFLKAGLFKISRSRGMSRNCPELSNWMKTLIPKMNTRSIFWRNIPDAHRIYRFGYYNWCFCLHCSIQKYVYFFQFESTYTWRQWIVGLSVICNVYVAIRWHHMKFSFCSLFLMLLAFWNCMSCTVCVWYNL